MLPDEQYKYVGAPAKMTLHVYANLVRKYVINKEQPQLHHDIKK